MLKSRHLFYEFGDKPGKTLALQLRLKTAKNFITQIQTQEGIIVSDPQEINNTFKYFYSSFYHSDSLKECRADGFPRVLKKVFPSDFTFASLCFSLNNGSLPSSLRQASTSLLLKPDKNPLECGSYCLISLLNVDVKILAKILALRLETV